MEPATEAHVARLRRDREQLAKEWLLRLLERTPLDEAGEIPVSWIASEAPPLIAGIVEALAGPEEALERELAAGGDERVEALARMRGGSAAAAQIPRDLAALQALMIESIRREIPERRPGDFADAVERLAEIFGSIQSSVLATLVEQRTGGAAADELTGLPGRPALDEWLRVLLAEHRRYGHPFALAVFDIDGLARVNEAYGRESGDRVLAAVASVVKAQIRATDQAFRLEDDELGVLAPHQSATGLATMAERIAELIDASQLDGAPRIAISAGVASCPADGQTAEALLEATQEATYAAKASGVTVSTRGPAPGGDLQDR